MKIKNYLRITLFFAILGLFSACKEDEQAFKEYNAAEANAIMQTMADDIVSDVNDIMQSEGLLKASEALSNIELNFDLGFINQKINSSDLKNSVLVITDYSKYIINKLPVTDLQKTLIENDLFESLQGIYTYNRSSGAFEFDNNSDGVNYIQLRFPSNSSDQNNAILTITALSMYTYLEGGSDFFNHFQAVESFVADLKIDGELISTVDLAVDYNQEEVIGIDLSLFLKPYTLIVATSSNEKSITNTLSFRNGMLQLASYDLTVTFDKQISDESKVMQFVEGVVQYRNMSANGKINPDDLLNSTDQKIETLNEAVNIELFFEGSLIGRLQFDYGVDQETLLYIVFTDGSKKLLSEYFKDINLPI